MPTMTQKPQAIAFDWDGTLANTRDAVIEAMDYTLKLYDKEPWQIVRTRYRNQMLSLKENFANFFGVKASEAYETYLQFYRLKSIHQVRPMPGAPKLLRFLTRQEVPVSIISNKERSLLLNEVDQCFPNMIFDKIVGNGDAPHNKPAPDPVWTAYSMAPFDITPQNVWLVGDSQVDLETAVTAGCLAVIIVAKELRYTNDTFAALEKTGQLFVFNDLNEFLLSLKWGQPNE